MSYPDERSSCMIDATNDKNSAPNPEQINNEIISEFIDTSKGNAMKCPFLNRTYRDIYQPLEMNYSVDNLVVYPYSFIFDKINYKTNKEINGSKKIREYPKHLQNTLFMNNERIREIHEMQFNQSFTLISQLLDHAETLYKSKKFIDALYSYGLIYSLLKWLEFSDKDSSKEKEKKIKENFANSFEHPILDEDIIIKTPKFSDPASETYKYDKDNYRRNMQFLLKRLSKCYMMVLDYKEANLCLDEAKDYVDEECPDIYFRKAQLKIYNKYSRSKELRVALGELNKALSRKITFNQEILLHEHKKCSELIKEKEEEEIELYKKILNGLRYALDKIKKKNLNIKDYISSNDKIDMTNYNILKEVKNIYINNLRNAVKEKNYEKFNSHLHTLSLFLPSFIQYERLQFFDLLSMPPQFLSRLEPIQRVDLALAVKSEVIRNLASNLVERRKDALFCNLKISSTVFEHAEKNARTRMEVEEVNEELKKLKSSIGDISKNNNNPNSIFGLIRLIINNIKENPIYKLIESIDSKTFYFFSVSFIILLITIYLSPKESKGAKVLNILKHGKK